MKCVLLILTALCGCAVGPHGSKATHRIWTFQPGSRPDGLVRYEVITDHSAGRGAVFMMDPKAQSAVLSHTNSMLQTGGTLIIGDGAVSVDPQASTMVEAVGTAAGNIVGSALRKAAGVP